MKRTVTFLFFALAGRIAAQGGRGAPTGKADAPFDLTGYYVSVVTEDWRYRMMTPAKGDFPSICDRSQSFQR